MIATKKVGSISLYFGTPYISVKNSKGFAKKQFFSLTGGFLSISFFASEKSRSTLLIFFSRFWSCFLFSVGIHPTMIKLLPCCSALLRMPEYRYISSSFDRQRVI